MGWLGIVEGHLVSNNPVRLEAAALPNLRSPDAEFSWLYHDNGLVAPSG